MATASGRANMTAQIAGQAPNRPKSAGSSISRTEVACAQPLVVVLGIVLFSLISVSFAVAHKSQPFIPAEGSTSPGNGDLNPYGLAVVPKGFPGGTLQPGQLLVSNFNDSASTQGNGSTIVIIDPATGQQTGVFFQGRLEEGTLESFRALYWG